MLKICKNRFDGRAFEYCFEDKIKRQQGIIFCKSLRGLSLAGSKKMKGFYDVDVTVTERSQNEKMEVKEGVMFKRDASFANLRGLVGYWFRFHTANKRYIITFSLWEKDTRGEKRGILLDEVHIDVETGERKRSPLSRRKKLLCLAEEVREEASLPGEIHSEPTSLPEGSHKAVEGSEQFKLPNDNGRLPSLPFSEETRFSGKKLWEYKHMTAGKRIQTPPKRKRRRKLLCPATDKPEETSLPGEIHSKPTSLPEGIHELEENEQCLPVSKETKFSGENLPGYNHMTAEKLKQASQFMSNEMPLRRKLTVRSMSRACELWKFWKIYAITENGKNSIAKLISCLGNFLTAMTF